MPCFITDLIIIGFKYSFHHELYQGNRQESQKYLLPASKYENLQVFYLGCSFGFEHALQQAKVPLRNVDQNKNVSMYKTNIHMNPGKV